MLAADTKMVGGRVVRDIVGDTWYGDKAECRTCDNKALLPRLSGHFAMKTDLIL